MLQHADASYTECGHVVTPSGIGTPYRLLLFLSSATKTGTTMAKMTKIAKRLPKSRSIPSTTPQDREAKRLRILEAAAAEFAQYGFDNASIESIASRAGFGKGTIYNYTGSKDQLFSECLQLFCDELHQLLEETVRTSTHVPDSQRVALINERLADLAQRRPDFVTMYFASMFGVHPRDRDLVVQSARKVITELEQLFVTGQRHGIVRDDAPADLMASLVFMNRLVFSRMLDSLDVRNHSRTKQAEFLFDMHWSAIKAGSVR
jgi:AcrR family transcriptional regulator